MTTLLLDVNVLVALAWPVHVHHASAHAWFGRLGTSRWATCPVTQSGFVRVSSNKKVLPDAKTPGEALELLRRIVALKGHEFWDDATNLATSPHLDAEKILTHAHVTDAHLLALALARGGCLVTFDAGVRRLLPRGVRDERLLLLGTGR